ncbi:zinc carboxypeptidase-like [Nasonia vitripennis]|uniref:Zinc carboxypeptidase A 1 n=1 Tax=Nasonia vitripennis TaxID=7425 RepID=A0A7M7T7G8_NASVI|nr:zinc carboxypeptidase-like [Nasonia vitripennis]
MLRYSVLVFAVVAFAAAENAYKVFRITPENEEQFEFLYNLDDKVEGFDFWKSPSFVSQAADLMVAPEKLSYFSELMASKNIKYESFIDNVEALLEIESNNRTRIPSQTRAATFGWTSYHTLEEIYSWLDSLAQRYPSNVEVIIGGRTYEGRKIKGVKLSFAEGNKGVFIEGGIHAREWISHATVTYLINQFLISKDPAIRKVAESYDWYIFPVFNPDGYAFTHINVSNASMRMNFLAPIPFSGCYGTDMNRNWGFEWMIKIITLAVGASNDPCSEAYAGKYAFSEMETETLSKYITSISDKLFAYIAFHSYSQFLMFPYGHSKAHLDNYDEQYAIGKKAVEALSRRYGTYYKLGNIGEVIGYASGTSLDWVKSSFKLPLVYIYELRDRGNSGFVLPPNQIIPNGQEVMDSLVALFGEANKYGYPK